MSIRSSVIIEFRAVTAKAQAALSVFGKEVSVLRAKVNGLSGSFGLAGSSMKGFIAGFAGIHAIRAAVTTIASFDTAMASVKANASATGVEMDLLKKKARELGRDTVFNANEVAEGMDTLAKAGRSVSQILEEVGANLFLASAGATDMETASKATLGVLNGFQLPVTEVTRVTDLLAKAAKSANQNVFDISESMKKAAPTAKQFGLSIEETTAVITLLARNNITAAESGTALRQVLRALSNITPEASDVLKQYGVTVRDINPEIVGFKQAVDNLASAHLSATDAAVIFQAREAAGAEIISGQVDVLHELITSLEDAQGSAEDMADTKLDTLTGDFRLLVSAVTEVTLGIGGEGGLTEAMRGMVQSATESINKMSQDFEGITDKIKGIISVIDTLFLGLVTSIKLAVTMVESIITVTIAFGKVLTEIVRLGIDEVGLLSRAFGAMTADVKTLMAALSLAVSGNFMAAAGLIKTSFGEAFTEVAGEAKTRLVEAGSTINGLIEDASENTRKSWNKVLGEIVNKADAAWERIMNRFSSTPQTPAGATGDAGTEGGADGSTLINPDAESDALNRASADFTTFRSKINNELQMLLAARYGHVAEAEQREQIAYQAQLDRIDSLQVTNEEADQLKLDAQALYLEQRDAAIVAAQEKEYQDALELEAKKKALRDAQLAATSNMFGDLATVAKAFGKKGFAAYKAFAIASALIDAYRSAGAAYASAATIPAIGWLVAPIAAAAALAAGVAQVQQIRSQQYEDGGFPQGSNAMIQVNENGQEAVINARGTRNLGSDLINRINAGLVTAQDMAENASENVASQLPSEFQDGYSSGQMSSDRPVKEGRGGIGKIFIALVDSRDMAVEMGADYIIDVIRNNKTAVGIPV